ncbi:MAG TPA: ABC transporter ATP-binding protein, partial [Bradyrhizobium sp.]|nr:ABC transporter ATP-binding protein [Bradyrhizobium sp.]
MSRPPSSKPPSSKPPSSDDQIAASADDPIAAELDQKLAADADAPDRSIGGKPTASSPPDEDEDDDELDVDDDEDDEDLVVFTAKEAAGALATIYAFFKPFLKNYKAILAFVGLGVLVETLF